MTKYAISSLINDENSLSFYYKYKKTIPSYLWMMSLRNIHFRMLEHKLPNLAQYLKSKWVIQLNKDWYRRMVRVLFSLLCSILVYNRNCSGDIRSGPFNHYFQGEDIEYSAIYKVFWTKWTLQSLSPIHIWTILRMYWSSDINNGRQTTLAKNLAIAIVMHDNRIEHFRLATLLANSSEIEAQFLPRCISANLVTHGSGAWWSAYTYFSTCRLHCSTVPQNP
jgi:hypothetical protein